MSSQLPKCGEKRMPGPHSLLALKATAAAIVNSGHVDKITAAPGNGELRTHLEKAKLGAQVLKTIRKIEDPNNKMGMIQAAAPARASYHRNFF